MAKDREGFAWKTFLTQLSSFGVLLLCLTLLLGAAFGLRPLESRAAAATRRDSSNISIRWPGQTQAKPTWLPRVEQEQLLTLARNAADEDERPFTPATLERVSRALSSSGWFKGYPTVRRLSAGSIEVDGDWRVPAAVVRSGESDLMIAWDATPLPPRYPVGTSNYPVIMNAAKGPPVNAGGARVFDAPWQGEDVGAALELIQTLMDQPWFSQISGIDVGQYGPERTLTIVTRANTRVVWGGRASKPRPGEVSTRDKLNRLSQLHRDTKRIDGGFPLVMLHTLNIQFDRTATAQLQTGGEAAPPAP